MDIDPKKDVQRLRFGSDVYVLVREDVYENLQHRLDGLHAALEAQKNRTQASANYVEALLLEKLTFSQVQQVLQAPTFGKRLALLREFRGWDQSDLAQHAALSQSTISKLETGETSRPSHEAVRRIFEALDLPDLASYPLFKKELSRAGSARTLANV
jgi:ribosome-binding protein aMBF1 (putative translation factor)